MIDSGFNMENISAVTRSMPKNLIRLNEFINIGGLISSL